MLTSQECRFGSSVNGTDDREAHPKFWIALYTRPRSEKKVRAYLDSIGIENFLPVQYQLRQWSDRKKLVEVVVIPMVIFVSADASEIPNITHNSLIIKAFTPPRHRKNRSNSRLPDRASQIHIGPIGVSCLL